MLSAADGRTIQKIVPDILLGPGKDRTPDLGAPTNHEARTLHYKICSVRSTKLQGHVNPAEVHSKMGMIHLGLVLSRARGQVASVCGSDSCVIQYYGIVASPLACTHGCLGGVGVEGKREM